MSAVEDTIPQNRLKILENIAQRAVEIMCSLEEDLDIVTEHKLPKKDLSRRIRAVEGHWLAYCLCMGALSKEEECKKKHREMEEEK